MEAALDRGLTTPGSTVTAQGLLTRPEPHFPHQSAEEMRTCQDDFSLLLEATSEGLSHIPSRLKKKFPKALQNDGRRDHPGQGHSPSVPGAGCATLMEDGQQV